MGTPSCSTVATSASAVGSYAITCDVSGLSATNYSFVAAPGTLTITQAVITVTADDKSRQYGLANPAFTATPSGFRNGDTAAVISGTPSCSTVATSASAVGSYAITCDVSGLSATNYSFVAAPGTLTITQAVITVTADDKSR